MKRKYLTIITGFVLSFSLLSFPVYAADEPVQPEIPIEQTEESITEYNSQVDEYNSQVNEYNKEIDSNYEQQVKEYNETIEYNNQEEQSVNDYNALETEKVDTHNQEEDEKVTQNQLDIEQYKEDLKQYEENIVKYEEDLEQYEKDKKQYEADLKNENIVKTYYGAESVEDYNMKIFKTPDEEKYNEVLEQAVDRRIVREKNTALKDKEYSSTITKEESQEKTGISYLVHAVHHFVDNYFQDIHVESFEEEIDLNDTVTITSLANNNSGTKTILDNDKTYPIFYTYISDKYLSYYWYESFAQAEYTSLKNRNDFTDINENGDKYTYTLKNGKKYYSDTPYFSVDYYYMPYLTINKPIEPESPIEPEKPVEVKEYNPEYWEYNFKIPEYKEVIEPVKGKYLNKLDYLKWNKPIEKEEEKEPVIPEKEEEIIPTEEEEPIIPSEELEPRAPVQPSYNPVPQTVEVLDPIPEETAAAYYVTIEEKEFPKAAPKVILPLKAKTVITQQEIIDDDPVPLSMSYSSTSYWALLNLLLTILTVIELICLTISYIYRYEKDEEENKTENKYNYYPIRRLIQIGVTFITILVFIYTEDITLPMRFVDKYTIIMILLALVSTIFMILSKRKKEEDTQGE